MNIIITGGAGFLGRHLCRALVNLGHQIKIIDLNKNPEYETIKADVRDAKKMKELITNADVVFHLASLIEAGESVEKPDKYIDYNINGTLSVLEAMRLNGLKTFIFSSSAAIYGEPEQVPIKENDKTLPINPYGMTKLAMEGLIRSYVEAHEFTGVALRYFNLYGPGEHHQPETHAIPRFIEQVYKEEEVTVWGNGEHLRDYVYIDDIVSAHLKTFELIQQQPGKYHYMNLSTEKPSSVMEVVKTIEQAMNKKVKIKYHSSRPGDPLQLYADAKKAENVLSWKAKVDLENGIKKTVEYFLQFYENHN